MDDVNGILSTSKKYTDKRMQEINNSRDRLVEKDASVRESLSTFDNAYSSMLIAQGALEKSINDYSPSQYLENEIIQGLQQSLGKNQNTIQEKIETQNKQYEDYVEKVYTTSEENTKKQAEKY